jgi:hypothetical protein
MGQGAVGEGRGRRRVVAHAKAGGDRGRHRPGASGDTTPPVPAPSVTAPPTFTFIPPKVGPLQVVIGGTYIGGKLIDQRGRERLHPWDLAAAHHVDPSGRRCRPSPGRCPPPPDRGQLRARATSS